MGGGAPRRLSPLAAMHIVSRSLRVPAAGGAAHGVMAMHGRADLVGKREVAPTGTLHRGEAVAPLCLVVARSIAPRPSLHRINVVHYCCRRWCLGLADAVCCAVVVVVRSGAHARALPLGSFAVFDVLAQNLFAPWMLTAAFALVCHPAFCPPRPVGHTSGAPSDTRAMVHLAGRLHRFWMRSSPWASTLGSSCSASPSTQRSGAPTWSERMAEEVRACLLPLAAASAGGIPPEWTLGGVTRLAARGAPGSACVPASAEASSQPGAGEGLGRRRIGGGGIVGEGVTFRARRSTSMRK